MNVSFISVYVKDAALPVLKPKLVKIKLVQ